MRLCRVFLIILMISLSTALSVQAQEWGQIANISATMGVSDSRICIGEASRGDLGCPSYAPTVSATGRLNVSSGLTADTVSLTTAGTTWGYLGSVASYLPNFSSNAVSATNISASTINGVSVSALGGGASPTNVPAFSVHKNGTNQTVTANTRTLLTWSTEAIDNYNNFSSNRFTPTVAGRYLVNLSMYCPVTNVLCQATIAKNGTDIASHFSQNASGVENMTKVIVLVDMNGTTDYLEAYGQTGATSINGSSSATFFQGSLIASGNGLVSGTGATALSGLTDVTLSSPATGQVLTYNGTRWVNATPSATTVISGTTSMVEGWPDALQCADGSGNKKTFLLEWGPSTGKFYYIALQQPNETAGIRFVFNLDGSFSNAENTATSYNCNNKSISTLYAEGKAFNFIGNSGSGGSAMGDRLTSGTLNVTANSATSVVSLTTGATTWGYMGSTASYLPNFGSNQVSSTAISTTAVQIASSTTVTSCSSTNAGTLRFNSSNTALELCTGTGWQVMGVGIPAGTISAFASTTCPTGWSEYTPARGRFLRGIDNGAGNDPSGTRVPNDIQDDLIKTHTHTAAAGSEVVYMRSSGNYTVIGSGGFGVDRTTAPLGASGGAESRPKNVAVIFCQFNGTSNGWNNPLSGGSTTPGGSTGQIQFNSAGAFAGSSGLTWDNATTRLTVTNISTTALTVNGVAITGSSALGDRLTSGTLNVTANSATSVVSLTTGATTWGYMGSTASYLPNFSSNVISATNISVTTINGVSVSALGGASPTNVPAFRAHKGGTNQTVTSGAITALTWSAEEYDTTSAFNPATGRFTPTVAGRYLIYAQAYCPQGSTVYCQVLINKNGGQIATNLGRSSVGDVIGSAATIVDMNGTTDYIDVSVINSGGTSINGSSSTTFFTGSLLASGNGLVSGTGATALSGLTDVTLASPATGQVLTYNGSTWVNSSGASGDRITSGTLNVTANSATSVVSLTTGATTWGYMGSTASYLPNFSSNAISATNISATTINGVAVSSLGGASPTNVPAFRATKTASQSITASTWTKMTLAAESFDTYNNFDTGTSRFTPTVAGYYYFTGSIACDVTGGCYAGIYKNGTQNSYAGTNSAGVTVQASSLIYMNGTTDYVELWGYSNGTSPTVNSLAAVTYFTGTLVASGNGLVSGTGSGVSAMSSLTDVTLTSPVSNSLLVYDGSKWVNRLFQDTVSTTTMVSGWPDAIMCNISNPTFGMIPFYAAYVPYSVDGKYYYRANIQNGTAYTVVFTSAGAFDSYQNITTSNCNVSISSLYSQGRAFNFIGGSGTGSTAMGDRLTSGTLAVTANSSTAVVSLTTGATTWGYLGSTASYLPNLSTNALTVGGLTITSSSLVSNSAQVAFSAHRNGTNQTVTNGGYTKMLFTTEEFDTNNNFDTTTSRFTPTIAGKYLIQANAYCGDNTVYCLVAIYKNGSLFKANISRQTVATVAETSVLVDMNGTTDYVEAYVYNSGGTSLSGLTHYTRFSGALFNGGGSGGGSGVSAIASLTDVTLTSPVSNSLLVYDGSKWVNRLFQDTVSTTTMSPNWPDAIMCGGNILYISLDVTTTPRYQTYNGPNVFRIIFNANGTINASQQMTAGTNTTSAWTSGCEGQTITTLYSSGKAFNFIGGNGSGGTAMGDSLTSGTLAVTANSSTAVVSLTTGATTWGYMGSTASYLPNFSSNAISTSSINLGGFNLTSSSLVSNSAQVLFKVHKNGTGQALPTTTWTKLTFSTKELDTNNNFSTATSRFTPTVAGNYLFSGSAYCTGSICWTSVYKNGVQVSQNGSNNWAEGMPSTNVIVPMNGSTDYVELYSYNNGTTVSGVSNQTYFQGFLIGGGSGSGGGSSSGDRITSGTTSVIAQTSGSVAITAPVEVSGSLNLSNNPAAACASGSYGVIKQVGGRLMICRQ